MSKKKGASFKGKGQQAAVGVAWSQANEGAQGLWEILQQSRGPGRGIGVSCRVDPSDPEDNADKAMLRARAVDILIGAHPELTVTLWHNDIFVAFREDLAVLKASESWQHTEAILGVSKGTDLVVRTLGHRSRKDEVIEQYPRWPGALDGKMPYDASEADWTAWREGLAAYREREAARSAKDGDEATT